MIGLGLNLFIIIFGEILTRHGTADAERAKKLIVKGPFKDWFWFGAILFGNVFPLALLYFASLSAPAVIVASLASLIGLLIFEHIWVVAGQSVPLS